MKKSKVSVIRNEDSKQATLSALDAIGARDIVRDKKVFIKLNFGGPSNEKGAIVSEEVTRAVIEYVKPVCREVKAGEQGRATREESEALFNRTWARRMEGESGVDFLNLWEDEYVTVEVPHPMARKEWRIPRTIADSDIVVSLACLKVSAAAGVTLAMKNFFGIIHRKNKAFLHGKIHEVIVDLHQIVKPSIGIIDGIYGWEGGESALGGNPVGMDLVLAGRDLVALDAVATEIMGRRSSAVQHIQWASELGLGTSDLSEIEIVGERMEDVRKPFKKVPLYQRIGSGSSIISGLANCYYIWRGEGE